MSVRRPLVAAVAALGLLVSVTASGEDDSRLSIHWQDQQLIISGDLSSTAHRSILDAIAEQSFAGSEHNFTLAVAVPPAGWSLVTAEALRAVAATRHADVEIRAASLRIDGQRDEGVDWLTVGNRLQRSLLPGMQLIDNVTVHDDSVSFSELCLRQFDAARRDRRVAFRHSSSELSPASLPLLDALVEIVADCPQARLVITGHTDTSGDAAFNQALSERRAAAVVDYFVRQGIAAARLQATGAGASQPLSDARTPAARARNRRIEFEWLDSGNRPAL